MNGDYSEKKDTTIDSEEVEVVEEYRLFFSCRLGISLLGFCLFLILLAQRASMGVAMVCMVNHTALAIRDKDNAVNLTGNEDLVGDNSSYSNGTWTKEPSCGVPNSEENGVQMEDGPFVWDKRIQGQIHSAFYLGYFIAQFPMGIVADRVDAKWVLALFYGLSTLGNLLTPIAAEVHYIFLMVMRVLVGFGTSAVFPCMHVILSRWAPPYEVSRLASFTYSGVMGGGVIGLLASGFLCNQGFSQGWDSIFYIFGIISTLLWVLWMALANASPLQNKLISKKEKLYITSKLKGHTSRKTKGRIPVLAILKSGPFWAITFANFCSDWGLYTLITNTPTFLKEVHHFDIQSNGLMSSLPFIGCSINMYISPLIADKLMTSKIFSTTVVRKIMNTVGMVCPAGFLLGVSFLDCTNASLAVVFLALAGTMSGCIGSGYLINHIEIAPKFAGTLVGVTNGMAAASGFLSPLAAASLTKNGTQQEWQRVFYIAVGIYLFGALMYGLLASAEIQPWAIEKEELEAEEIALQIDVDVGASDSSVSEKLKSV